jgi:hypothetical protein
MCRVLCDTTIARLARFLIVLTPTPTRLTLALLITGILLLALPPRSAAQDADETPLGDVARSFRKKPAASEVVVDNDNLSKALNDAESRHVAGSSMVFSLDPAGKSFRVSSPDVTCSLSFSASSKTSALLNDPLMLDELPRSEMAKLDGPATIDGDSLQVSMHNGTAWELREVVIGLTIVKRPDPATASSNFGQARIVPAVAGSPQQAPEPFQKQPDVTLLLKVKGSAAPSATGVFRTALNFALFPDQDWHWAIVKAKGIPPQTPTEPSATPPTQPEKQDRPAAPSPDATTNAAAPAQPPQ